MEEQKGQFWVWMSFVPKLRLILATTVGDHEEQTATQLLAKTKRRIKKRPLPLFVSDGWDAYIKALLNQFHKIIEYPLTGKRGRPRKPRHLPDNQLRYAQIVKIRDQGKVVSVLKRVIYGNEEQVDHSQISTSLIERENLSLRQDNCRLARKTIAFSKLLYYLNCQLTLYVTYHNFVRPHRGLFEKVNEVVVGRVKRKWKSKTPAMAADITDHAWSLRELFTFKAIITSTN